MRLKRTGADPLRSTLLESVCRPDIWCPRLLTLRLNDLLQVSVQAIRSTSSLRAKASSRIQTAMFTKY
jgi:hypothetical protein